MLNIKQLYLILKVHDKLAEERSPMFTQNKYGKIISYFMFTFIIGYLMLFAVMFALDAKNFRTITAYEFLYSLLPFIVVIDIGIRFMAQETPSQHVKPYALLPISRYTCINFYIIRSLTSYGNLIWMFLYVPYALMTIVFSEGIGLTLLFILGFYVIELLLSQIYSIFRTLVNHNLLYWFLAVLFILIIAFPIFFNKDWSLTFSIARLLRGYDHLGDWICKGNLIAWAILCLLLVLAVYANRCLQYKLVYAELSRQEKTMKVSSDRKFTFMDKWGVIGEFMHLEILSIRRNKNIRKSFLSATVVVLIFSIICSFSSVYDEMGMLKFWMVYNFTIFGTMFIMRIMMPEGNYIERLMVDHSSIETLLRAKYYLYSAILTLPFILMIPMVVTGKSSLITLIAFFLFAAGFVNFVFMQMAAYNKQSMQLNQKIIGKMKTDNFWITMGVTCCGLAFPLLLYKILLIITSETIAASMLILLGLGFIITHKVWIHHIYLRMMKRKYKNIEAMIATRNL